MWKPIEKDEFSKGIKGNFYGWNGQSFPRLNLYIVKHGNLSIGSVDYDKKTLWIICQEQKTNKHHWKERNIPFELTSDLIDLLKKVR